MALGVTGLLERSAELDALRDGVQAARTGPGGRLILLAGEAGIGKTALLREFREGAERERVLWGACDALHTPRPLGPLLDIAAAEGGRLAAAAEDASVRDVSQGPRRSTRENPVGLTARQLDVLELVAEGLRNSEIAAQLFLSEKTVDHHVSAILQKLDARTRGEAVSKAVGLGITAS